MTPAWSDSQVRPCPSGRNVVDESIDGVLGDTFALIPERPSRLQSVLDRLRRAAPGSCE